jgi:hypothetical protein
MALAHNLVTRAGLGRDASPAGAMSPPPKALQQGRQQAGDSAGGVNTTLTATRP